MARIHETGGYVEEGAVILTAGEAEHIGYNVLPMYADRMIENATEFEQLAAHLRAGGTYPMFGTGEAGAASAEHLAEAFRSQAGRARTLAVQILDEVEVPA